MHLFEYPKKAAFGRPIPKNKIYEHSNPSSSLKQFFIRQVQQIVWEYKLASETINLPQTKSVPELQVFRIILKEDELKHDVLRCIDKTIPFPIIFELCFEEKVKVIAAYKRPSLADNAKWVLSDYFESTWMQGDSSRMPLPRVPDLEMLYTYFLSHLMPFPPLSGETLQAYMERTELIGVHQKEIEKCHSRLRREKQFSHKIAINAELRSLKQKLQDLTRSVALA